MPEFILPLNLLSVNRMCYNQMIMETMEAACDQEHDRIRSLHG